MKTADIFPELDILSGKGCASLFAAILLAGIVIGAVRTCDGDARKEEQARSEMRQALKHKVTKDPWGNDYRVTDNKEENYREARSAGADGIYGTEDDIVRKDYNKSKIAGKWVGMKGKQFLKGLKDGITEKEEEKE